VALHESMPTDIITLTLVKHELSSLEHQELSRLLDINPWYPLFQIGSASSSRDFMTWDPSNACPLREKFHESYPYPITLRLVLMRYSTISSLR